LISWYRYYLGLKLLRIPLIIYPLIRSVIAINTITWKDRYRTGTRAVPTTLLSSVYDNYCVIFDQGDFVNASQISVEIKCCFPNPEYYRITSGIPKSRSLDVKTLKTCEIKELMHAPPPPKKQAPKKKTNENGIILRNWSIQTLWWIKKLS
jgi:hypothetical protein